MKKNKTNKRPKVSYGGFGPITHSPEVSKKTKVKRAVRGAVASAGGKMKRASSARKEGRKERVQQCMEKIGHILVVIE